MHTFSNTNYLDICLVISCCKKKHCTMIRPSVISTSKLLLSYCNNGHIKAVLWEFCRIVYMIWTFFRCKMSSLYHYSVRHMHWISSHLLYEFSEYSKKSFCEVTVTSTFNHQLFNHFSTLNLNLKLCVHELSHVLKLQRSQWPWPLTAGI